MSSRGTLAVAAVQATPAYLDRGATLAVAIEHVRAAGADGAGLVVFPESFVPGYPDFVWRSKPWSEGEWYARFQDQAVDLSGSDLDDLRAAAEAAGTWVALGITERSRSGSLYNAVVYIDSSGRIAGVHRKLVPTGAERLVWANGTGPVLTVVDTGGARVGSLICWEAYMPLARAALYQQGIDVLLAPTWDNSDVWVSTLRHIAKEGQVFVVGVSAFLRGSDMPRDLPGADEMYGGTEDHLSYGNTTIVAPGGGILEGPLVGEAGVVTSVLDLDAIAAGRRTFDPVGHYSRPDLLNLTITNDGGNR
ncbi:carbon-nitrogen hydrolase family protein [Lolliginicoccus suaedae]|uniref:carbon-nitrogen hydrolase family protein n=1 Tax=Lolliginicoccus suaedae TaxID=2605429 RepID=UPI0011EF9C54|nr:carbon-nitrogen hydrolase family protein [Lolliginicoccus suaedae]